MSRSLAACLAGLAGLAGCHSVAPAEAAPDLPLPATWQAWRLYRSGGTWVYARDARAAGEAAALVRVVETDFRAATGREPSARFLVVADGEGWMPGGDPRRRLDLIREGEATLQDSRARREAVGVPASWDELVRQARRSGIEPAVLLAMVAHPLPMQRMCAEFGLPPELPALRDAAVLLPSEERVERSISATMDSALAEVPAAVRLLAAAYMPSARSSAVEAVLGTEKVLLFELEAAAVPDWSSAERARRVGEYSARVLAETEAETEADGDEEE